MSSVVNKSKNKFVPKAKARPRPGTVAATPPKPLEEPISILQEIRENTPALLPTLPSTQPEIEAAEPPRFHDGAPASWVIINTGGEEPHPNSRQRSVAPTLQMVNPEENHSAAPRSQKIPKIRSSSGIPSIRSSTVPTPTRTTTISEEEPEYQLLLKSKPRATRIKPKGKGKALTEEAIQEEATEVFVDTDSGEELDSRPKKKSTQKRKAKLAPGGEPAPKRKPQTRKKKPTTKENGVGRDGIDQAKDGATGKVGDVYAPKKKKRTSVKLRADGAGKPRGRRRAESPEDGESQEIAINVVKMKDLCKDLKIGKKSKRFLELQQADWTKLAKEQQDKQDAEERRANGEEEGEHETVEERLERLANERNRRTMNAPQLRIVNGQIVLDDESLQIDRRERDAVDEGVMEIVEENQNSRRVTSQTWSKREKVEKWDVAQTEKFYEALSMFGTDFEIISRMFTGRSRRQMRNKFNNEERKNPQKVTEALRTRIAVNIEEYSVMADQEFQDPKDLEEELQKLRDEHEAEEVAAAGHAVVAERERQEAANAAMHEGDNIVAVEQSRKTRKKKGIKGILSPGQEEVLMSREEYEEQRAMELALAEEF